MVSRPRPDIRPATVDDEVVIRSILAAHGNDGPIGLADVVGPYVRHLIAHGTVRVALHEQEVIGFGATIDAGRSIHLADLFVRPDLLGQGIGRALLDAVFGDAIHRTTFASGDPRALPLYVRAGMRPLAASLYVEGEPGRRPKTPGLRTRTAAADALAAIESAWTGHGRAIDHRFWSSEAEADSFTVVDGETIVGVGHARAGQNLPIRVLERLVIHPDTSVDPVAVTFASIERAGRGGPIRTSILGPSPVLRPLLEGGFRIFDRDQFMASDPDLVDPARLIPNSGML